MCQNGHCWLALQPHRPGAGNLIAFLPSATAQSTLTVQGSLACFPVEQETPRSLRTGDLRQYLGGNWLPQLIRGRSKELGVIDQDVVLGSLSGYEKPQITPEIHFLALKRAALVQIPLYVSFHCVLVIADDPADSNGVRSDSLIFSQYRHVDCRCKRERCRNGNDHIDIVCGLCSHVCCECVRR